MKRTLLVLFSLALVLATFACSRKEESAKPDETVKESIADEQPEGTTEKLTKAPTEAPTDPPTPTPTPTLTPTPTSTPTPEPTPEPSENLSEYEEEQFRGAIFEVPKSWTKTEDGNCVFFQDKSINDTLLIMIQFTDIEMELTPEISSLFWQTFVSGMGGDDFKMVNTSHHEFAKYECMQKIADVDFFTNCYTMLENNKICTISILYKEDYPNKNQYDSVLEHVVESFLMK